MRACVRACVRVCVCVCVKRSALALNVEGEALFKSLFLPLLRTYSSNVIIIIINSGISTISAALLTYRAQPASSSLMNTQRQLDIGGQKQSNKTTYLSTSLSVTAL